MYEAFLRFDDKPMITGIEAISKSLQRYCSNGDFCIAAGDGSVFTRYFLQENVPFLDVNDISFWLVDKSKKPQPQPIIPPAYTPEGEDVTPGTTAAESTDAPGTTPVADVETKSFKSITVSGSVPLERYTELFSYFITPFAMNGNKIDIEVSFKIKSNSASPIDESKQQYKSAKEAAKQLVLRFEEE